MSSCALSMAIGDLLFQDWLLTISQMLTSGGEGNQPGQEQGKPQAAL